MQLAGSHTHSSVMMDDPTIENWEHDGLCAAARTLVEERTVEAAVRAVADLRSARVETVRRPCPVTRSRRQRVGDRLVVGVDVPIDDAFLDVLAVSELDGTPMASVVVYGMHPTVLAWASLVFSPDYVGAIRDVVERGSRWTVPVSSGLRCRPSAGAKFSNQPIDADTVGTAVGYAAVAAVLEQRERTLVASFERVLESGAPLRGQLRRSRRSRCRCRSPAGREWWRCRCARAIWRPPARGSRRRERRLPAATPPRR